MKQRNSTFIIIVTIMVCMLCCSCATHKAQTAITSSIDTLVLVKRDTLLIEKTTTRKDSVIERHDTLIVVNDSGQIISRTITNNYYTYKEVADSTLYYKAMCDSLARIKTESVITEQPPDKKSPWVFLVIAFAFLSMVGLYFNIK